MPTVLLPILLWLPVIIYNFNWSFVSFVVSVSVISHRMVYEVQPVNSSKTPAAGRFGLFGTFYCRSSRTGSISGQWSLRRHGNYRYSFAIVHFAAAYAVAVKLYGRGEKRPEKSGNSCRILGSRKSYIKRSIFGKQSCKAQTDLNDQSWKTKFIACRKCSATGTKN